MARKGAAAKKAATSATGCATQRRWLGRRNTEEAADIAIQEHFKGASTTLLTQHKVQGVSLRDAVINARREAKTSGGRRLGAQFWAELRARYLADHTSTFEIADKSETVSTALVSALQKATTANTTQRSRSALTAWLHTTRSINQKELVGLCRFLDGIILAQNQVLNALPNSFKFTQKDKKGCTKELIGTDGLTALVADPKVRADAGDLTFDDLREVQIFAHLLPPGCGNTIDEITKQLLSAVKTTGKRKADSGGAASSPAAKRSKNSEDAAAAEKDAIMNLFG